METLLNKEEAAAFLGVGEARLKELVENKVVPAYMIAGEFMRFKKAELKTIRDMLGINAGDDGERIFNKVFSEVKGFEKFKEILRANDIYLIIGVMVFLILILMIFKM